MSKLNFKAAFRNSDYEVKVRLTLLQFQDEAGTFIIYSPHLDLSGYGETYEDAKMSFGTSYHLFVDHTLKKKTFGKVLKKLGWTVKGSVKKPKKSIAPSIASVIGENEYVSEIFDKYEVRSFHEEVPMPVFA